jgi:hypothetical protein
MSERETSLLGIVDTIGHETEGTKVSINDIVDVIGPASFTTLLLLPAIAVATPLSGIPLFSSFMGAMIFLVASQMLLGRTQLWLPNWLLKREVKRSLLRFAFRKLRPVLAWLERRTKPRLGLLVMRPLVFIPQLLCLISGLAMPFLEFVPFTSSLVGIAVSCLAVGMLARDGVVVALALAPYAGVAWAISLVA